MRTALDGLLLTALVLLAGLNAVLPFGADGLLPEAAAGLAVASYLLGRSPVPARVACPTVAAVLLLHPVLALMLDRGPTPALAGGALAVLCAVTPWLAGRYLRRRAEAAGLGWRRAELLEREQEVAAERERVRERARIAARMHDSLGHELTLIAVRAGALEVDRDLEAEDYRRGVAELGAGAISSVERLQEIIGLLREESEEPPTDPSREDFRSLVERVRESGMGVDSRGEELWDTLSPRAREVLYSVAREALTNAAKHAPGAPVTLELRSAGGESVLTVANGASRKAEGSALASGGHGLSGLRERLRTAGGSLLAEAEADGGFTVRARLPLAGEAPLPGPASAPSPASGPASESGRQRTASRSSARSALLAAVTVPLCLLLFLALLWGGYYVHASARSVLPPDGFAALKVGESLADAAAVLPAEPMLDPPTEAGAPVPGAWACSHYRSRMAWPGARVDAYRLCFDDGVLVSKDVLVLGADREENR
ncbi:signal transduction histidine kinase [Nocardiopsis arvandica]|uniref:histidine kinase n=1 Tax=Nocardiopsis sinuspersici TaxID=501010 RepID=A0A7Y9XBS9_9ACTN|nr:signal transduction histidine kinase [Nocardiopsis sinuspersici]